MKFKKKITLILMFILLSSLSCSFFQNDEDREYVFIIDDYYHKISCISMLGTTGTPITKENQKKKAICLVLPVIHKIYT